MALTTRKRKKAPRARRKTTGAGAAPLDNYKRAKDFFHFEVDKKEYLPIIKAYVKKKHKIDIINYYKTECINLILDKNDNYNYNANLYYQL